MVTGTLRIAYTEEIRWGAAHRRGPSSALSTYGT